MLDRTKDRNRKYKDCITIRDLYKTYKNEKKAASKDFLSEKDFKAICYEANKEIVNQQLEGEEVRLPYGLGTMFLGFYKPKIKSLSHKRNGLAPDWARTHQLWDSNPEAAAKKQLVYHTNKYIYRYKWKKGTRVPNVSLRTFIPTRTNKMQLTSLIKADKAPYARSLNTK